MKEAARGQQLATVAPGPEDGEDAGHFPHRADLIPDDLLPDGAGAACKPSADRRRPRGLFSNAHVDTSQGQPLAAASANPPRR